MNRIFITGDIHGNPGSAISRIYQIDNPTEEDKIIVCGDAGLEYGGIISADTKYIMSTFPGEWIIMRGNHDNRYWRNHTEISETYSSYIARPQDGWIIENNYLIEKQYYNIKYVKDGGGLYHIDSYNFLFIPGAYSVDKYYRLNRNLPYEKEERLNWLEKEFLFTLAEEEFHKIDFVIGHTFPLKMEKYYQDLFLSGLNESSIDKSMEQFLNIIMDTIEKHQSFKQYFGGHFHADRQLTEKYTMLYRDVMEVKDYVSM